MQLPEYEADTLADFFNRLKAYHKDYPNLIFNQFELEAIGACKAGRFRKISRPQMEKLTNFFCEVYSFHEGSPGTIFSWAELDEVDEIFDEYGQV